MTEASHTVTYLEVAPAAADEVAGLLTLLAQGAGAVGGNRRLEVYRRVSPVNHFALVASWASRGAYDDARAGAAGEALRGAIGPHLISGIDTRIHTAMIGGADQARGRGEMIAVTHVDVPPPNKDACVALLEGHIAASRRRTGCVRFEVFQQVDRPNHFSVVEAWSSQQAYEAHITSVETRQFRQQLTPLSGALYDERLYAPLA